MLRSEQLRDELATLVEQKWHVWVEIIQCKLRHKTPQFAEDIIQTALLKAFLHLDDFRAEAKLDTWIGAIIRNEFLIYFRKSPQMYRHVEVMEHAKVVDGESQALRARMCAEVMAWMPKLKPEEQNALHRRYWMEEPLDMAAKMRRIRALSSLRRKLGLCAAA